MGLRSLRTGLLPVLIAFATSSEGRVRCVSACPGDAGLKRGDVQWRVVALSLLPDTGEGEMRLAQARTGMRWMPRRHGPMKGVASCEKRRWAAGRQCAVDARMGQPGRGVKQTLKPHTVVLSEG